MLYFGHSDLFGGVFLLLLFVCLFVLLFILFLCRQQALKTRGPNGLVYRNFYAHSKIQVLGSSFVHRRKLVISLIYSS